jgi:hypothetical protein
MPLRTAFAALLVGTVAFGRAEAQRPGTVEFSALGVWHNKTTVHDGLRAFGAGGRLGVWLPAGFELEGQLDWTQPSNSIIPAKYTLLYLGASVLYNYSFASGPSIYTRAGYGRLDPKSPCTVAGVPCGAFSAFSAGAGFRVPVASAIQARAEINLRTRSAYDYNSVGASIGLTVLGGGRSSGGSAVGDEDQDGVADNRDRCRNTMRGALVDPRGCPTDLDGDGVSDGIDRCPGTPKGTPVDVIGCPRKPSD